MADITWSVFANQTFSPEQLDCAARGGSWDRVSQQCNVAPGLPISPPLVPPTSNLGTIDPQQMFDDGFVYINGQWVLADSPTAITYATNPVGPGAPRLISIVPQGTTVLGFLVPVAPAVALPSFVGGRMGTVALGQGMRPQSGGTARVRFGVGVLPEVRM